MKRKNYNITEYLKLFYANKDNKNDSVNSYEYCFNYFKSNKKSLTNNMDLSCLHLGFYLASWGMYRASAIISQKSYKIYEPVIKLIQENQNLFNIDLPYNDQDIEAILNFGNELDNKLPKKNNTQKITDTLKTKIIMGVFGATPAFDELFRTALHYHDEFKLNGRYSISFNKTTLEKLSNFYKNNKENIQDYNNSQKHTKAKLIDAALWTEGYLLSLAKKATKEKIENDNFYNSLNNENKNLFRKLYNIAEKLINEYNKS